MYLQQDLRRKKLELCKLHTFLFFSFSLCRKNPESNASALLVSIFHVISIVDVSTSITIQDVVLSFDSVDGIVAIQKKNSQQYFHMVIFVFHFFCTLKFGSSLRKQPTFGDVSSGFPAKWRLRNERRNSILMTGHYLDLGRASDWLKNVFSQSEALPRYG